MRKLNRTINEVPTEDLQETRDKLKIIRNKVATVRKERDGLLRENQGLQEELIQLQADMRQMIFTMPTSVFPSNSEIADSTLRFYREDCLDYFLDNLRADLEVGLFFFRECFQSAVSIVQSHLAPCEKALSALIGHIPEQLNMVVRKSCQSNWLNVCDKCCQSNETIRFLKHVQGNFLVKREPFVKIAEKLIRIVLCAHITDHPLHIHFNDLTQPVRFHTHKHEAFDGFIKHGEKCFVILPSILSSSGEIAVKGQVLHASYNE